MLNQDKTEAPDICCPYCKELIKKDAIKCKHCGEKLKSKSKEMIRVVQSKLKTILFSKRLWIGAILILSLYLAAKFIVTPLIEKYQMRDVMINKYDEYNSNKEEYKSNIHEILVAYQDLDTPIKSLNSEIKRIQELINNQKYTELVSLKNIGGYPDKGSKISMIEGFGMSLKNYATIENLTDIPLKVHLIFDLEETVYTSTRESDDWLGRPRYSSSTNKYVYEKDVHDYFSLNSLYKVKAYKSFSQVKYYDGYRITEEHNDGSYRYTWDGTRNFTAINLKIDFIEIYK